MARIVSSAHSRRTDDELTSRVRLSTQPALRSTTWKTASVPDPSAANRADATRFEVLGAISFSHFLNDMIQSLIIAIYPLLKGEFGLSFMQIGAITLTYQICASVLQPVIGIYTDKHPKPYSLSIGMGCTLIGLVTLSLAPNYAERAGRRRAGRSRLRLFFTPSPRASPGWHREAATGSPSLFFRSAAMPAAPPARCSPLGSSSLTDNRASAGSPSPRFSPSPCCGTWAPGTVGIWRGSVRSARRTAPKNPVSARRVAWSVGLLLILIFSKYFYLASITNYYSFYLIEKFHLSIQSAQLYLFAFLLAVALGTLLGGPIGDRVGRKRVIWFSILGVAPFTLVLPYVGLTWTVILSFIIGLILASAFSAILVFAQELMPGKVGAVSGLFFGFAFGMGGIGAAVLGGLADRLGVEFVYRLCAFLPLLGIVAAFLPDIRHSIAVERDGAAS